MPRPPSDNPAIKYGISLTADVYERGLRNARVRGFKKSFSAYLAWLIERDTAGSVAREDLPAEQPPIALQDRLRRSVQKASVAKKDAGKKKAAPKDGAA